MKKHRLLVIPSRVTRNGRVTIPAEIRYALGIKEGDRVGFVLEDDQVKLARKQPLLEVENKRVL
jgi:AbrB family looped-hinge helix DNA binding protein